MTSLPWAEATRNSVASLPWAGGTRSPVTSVPLAEESRSPVHSEANLSQTAQKREKKNIIILLVHIRDMVERDAVTKLHGVISMYIIFIIIQS